MGLERESHPSLGRTKGLGINWLEVFVILLMYEDNSIDTLNYYTVGVYQVQVYLYQTIDFGLLPKDTYQFSSLAVYVLSTFVLEADYNYDNHGARKPHALKPLRQQWV